MWIDERGSEVLGLLECRRLLALGAKEGRHGHVGLPDEAGPVVLPVNYAMHGPDVVLLVGDGLFARMAGAHVSFQVDGITPPRPFMGEADRQHWSVLVRGLAIEDAAKAVDGHVPVPEIMAPGHRVVRVRADMVSGRRFRMVVSSDVGPVATRRAAGAEEDKLLPPYPDVPASAG